jgi:hypothetical protein
VDLRVSTASLHGDEARRERFRRKVHAANGIDEARPRDAGEWARGNDFDDGNRRWLTCVQRQRGSAQHTDC